METTPLSNDIKNVLSKVTTASITTILLKKGLRNVWLRGTRPIKAGQGRLVGRAFTLRFVPAREDLATPASWGSPISTRAAIEAMPEGAIVVADSMGVTEPIGCGGVAVFPDDVIVVDDDGAVLIPKDLVEAVAKEGQEQERLEGWIMSEVERGVPLPGLYPPNDEAKARYAEFTKKK